MPYTPRQAQEISKLADELEEPPTSDAPADFIASDFVMMDIDSDTEEVVGLQSEQAQAHRHHYIPKTMQEMAEEHAARGQQQLGSDADDDLDVANDGEDETMASPQTPLAARPTRKSKKQATVKITLSSKASASVSPANNLSSSRSTKAKTNRKSSTKRKRRSSRKRVGEESDSAGLSLTDEEDEEDGEDQRPSSSKRARVVAKAKRTPVAITPTTRTLRPRTSKMTTQIEGEDAW